MEEDTKQPRSTFDKSFEVEGRYCIVTKAGYRVLYSKRSQLWNDKFKSTFVTLTLLAPGEADQIDHDAGLIFYSSIPSSTVHFMDIRYNEISGVLEF